MFKKMNSALNSNLSKEISGTITLSSTETTIHLGFKPKKMVCYTFTSSLDKAAHVCVYDEDVSTEKYTRAANGSYYTITSIGTKDVTGFKSIDDTEVILYTPAYGSYPVLHYFAL